ncbi:hypothetical protein CHS0354_034896 [Potamilus streckersoni]|uniref:C1q domain-containing protein n=1 Tax=Potamilus streckersoni TaxID=2493646 RepID=A0AAE0VQH8_9BIVA|nr:hypothetical protein CHS0354_034896 [Potamilus streckersoni]
MMYITPLLLLALLTSTLYGLDSNREHFFQRFWPKNNSGYFPTGNLEYRIALLEKTLSEGLQKLQNELDQQRARNDILEILLKEQQTKLKDRYVSIKEMSKSISDLRGMASIQAEKNKQLEEKAMKWKEANIAIRDGDTEMHRNETTTRVTEPSNKSRQQILNDNESIFGTRYLLDAKRETKTKIKKDNQVGKVAFYATVSVWEPSNLGQQHPIVFDHVVTNIGSAYHGNTGIFIAPVNGIYFFSVTAMSSPQHAQYFELVKDGVAVNDILADATGANHFASVTRAFVLDVGQGSEIWVQTVSADPVSKRLHSLSVRFTYSYYERQHNLYSKAFGA